MKSNTAVQIFLLIVGNALAILLALLALETTPTNFLGWFLLAISIAYGAGGVVYLWRNRDEEESTAYRNWQPFLLVDLPGFVAIFFAPPIEFLFLSSSLPHNLGMELAGLLIILFRSGHSRLDTPDHREDVFRLLARQGWACAHHRRTLSPCQASGLYWLCHHGAGIMHRLLQPDRAGCHPGLTASGVGLPDAGGGTPADRTIRG